MSEPESNDHQDEPRRDVEQPPAVIEHQHAVITDTAGGNHSDKKEANWPQRIEAVCAVLLVIITGFYTYYAAGQLHKMKRSTEATERAANAAKDSVDLARKNAHFDQRAWLGISYGTYKYAISQTFGATYEVTDTGKTPARNVQGKAVTRFMKSGDTPSFTYEHGTNVDLGTMLPNVHQGGISWLMPFNVRKEKHIQPMKISDEMFRALHNGSGYIMIYGNIGYDSVFGAHHWIKFCATSGPTFFTQPRECIDYNNVDGNDEP